MKINVLQLLGKKKDAPSAGKIAPGFESILRKEDAHEANKVASKQNGKIPPDADAQRRWASDETIFVHRLIDKSAPKQGGQQVERIVAHEWPGQTVKDEGNALQAVGSELADDKPKVAKQRAAAPEFTIQNVALVQKQRKEKNEELVAPELLAPPADGLPLERLVAPEAPQLDVLPIDSLAAHPDGQKPERIVLPRADGVEIEQIVAPELTAHIMPVPKREGPKSSVAPHLSVSVQPTAPKLEERPLGPLAVAAPRQENLQRVGNVASQQLTNHAVKSEPDNSPLIKTERSFESSRERHIAHDSEGKRPLSEANIPVPAVPALNGPRKPRAATLDAERPHQPPVLEAPAPIARPTLPAKSNLPERGRAVEHVSPSPLKMVREDAHVPFAPRPQEASESEHVAPPENKKQARPLSSGTEEAFLFSRTAITHGRSVDVFDTKRNEHKADKVAAVNVAAQAVAVDHVVARAQSQQVTSRVMAPVEKDEKKTARVESTKELPRETQKTDDPLPLSTSAHQATPAVNGEQPFRIESPTVLKDAAPLAPLASVIIDDPTLRAVLLPTIARMSMDTGDNGQLNVQVKVHEGLTDVRATGPGAQLLEARQGELRVALAREGLALGHFDLTQSGSQQQRHFERPDPEMKMPPTARRAASPSETATEDGRIHVKA